MLVRDLLVATVACGLGLSILQVAWTNCGWCFESFFVKQIEAKHGRTSARKALGLAGSTIILVGAWTIVAPLITSNRQNDNEPQVIKPDQPQR